MINVVGLGATDENDLTYKALKIINNGKKNFLRTDKLDAVNYFKDNNISYFSFDYVYEEDVNKSFEDVYNEIVSSLLEEENKWGEINYFVPGNPFVAEKTVEILRKKTETTITSGISFIEPILSAVGRDAVDGLLFLDYDFNIYDLNPDMDIIITQIYNRRIASDVSLKLQEIYPPQSDVTFIKDAGLKSQYLVNCKVFELSRIEDINHRCALYIPRSERFLYGQMKKALLNFIDESNLSYDKKSFEVIKDKARDIIKNLDNNDDDSAFQFYFYAILLSELANIEGYYNKYDIFEKILEKMR